MGDYDWDYDYGDSDEGEDTGQGQGGQGSTKEGPSLDDYQHYNRKLGEWRDKWRNSRNTTPRSKGGASSTTKAAKAGASTETKAAAKAGAKTAARTGAAAGRVAGEAAAAPETLGLSLVAAIPDIVRTAKDISKTKVGKAVEAGFVWWACGGCVVVLLVILFPVVLAFFILFGQGGSEKQTLEEVFCPEEGDFNCYLNKVMLDPCYRSALTNAETATKVPWQILAAIDFKQWELGEQDERGVTNLDALIKIGQDVQKANYLRDFDNNLVPPGNIETIHKDPDYDDHKDLLYGGFAIRAYRCMFIKDEPDNKWSYIEGGSEEAFRACECEKNDRLSEMLHDKWMSQNSQVPGMGVDFELLHPLGDADYTDTGALVFYNMLINGCDLLAAALPPPGTDPPGTGTPGECVNGVASVTPFLQCGGDWGNTNIGTCSDTMCIGGCGLTSLTMVLNWYGKGIDPADSIAYVNSLSSVPYLCTANGGWYHSMFDTVAQHYGMTAEKNTLSWDGIKEKLRNCEPIIVNITNQTWTYNWHFVVLTGMDAEGNIHVNDPYPMGNASLVLSESEVSSVIGDNFYVHN